DHKTAAVDLHLSAVVWIVVLGDSEVITRGIPGLCYGPFVDVLRPVVGSFTIFPSRGFVTVEFCDLGCTDKSGDLRGNRGRRVAGFLFPAILICAWSTIENEIRSRFDVLEPCLSIVSLQLVCEHERQG